MRHVYDPCVATYISPAPRAELHLSYFLRGIFPAQRLSRERDPKTNEGGKKYQRQWAITFCPCTRSQGGNNEVVCTPTSACHHPTNPDHIYPKRNRKRNREDKQETSKSSSARCFATVVWQQKCKRRNQAALTPLQAEHTSWCGGYWKTRKANCEKRSNSN